MALAFLLLTTVFVSLFCLNQSQGNCGFNQNTLNDVLNGLKSLNYNIKEGSFVFLYNTTAFGANPSSVYGVYQFGLENNTFWTLNGSSAVLFHGCSPPSSKYYSFAHYVFTNPNLVFASKSVSKKLNHPKIKNKKSTTQKYKKICTLYI